MAGHAATSASTKCWYCEVLSKAWRQPEVAVSEARRRKKGKISRTESALSAAIIGFQPAKSALWT